MRHVWLLVLVLSAASCSGTPANFWRGLARTLCKYNVKCAGLEEDVGACMAGMYADSEEPEEFAMSCPNYDASVGRACLAHLRDSKRDCVDPSYEPDACNGICGPDTTIQFTVPRDASDRPVPVVALLHVEASQPD